MSTNRLRLQVDQENQHKVGPAKSDLRNAQKENAIVPNVPTKRPLSAKNNVNEKRARVPLGGKNPNQIFPGLQRSKSSLPSTFHTPSLRQRPNQGEPLSAKPTLAKSNSSLGFFNRPASVAPAAPKIAKPRPTNPHKNDLLPPDVRSRDLDRFSSDSLTKRLAPQLPAVRPLSETLSDATSQLHVSNVNFEQPFARNVDPMKKGAMDPETERMIEELAEDENSIETVPERPESPAYVPVGVSPLSKSEAPFLYEDAPKKKMADMFAPDTEFFTDDEICSENEMEMNTAFHEELTAGEPNHTLGLTEGELEAMLDF